MGGMLLPLAALAAFLLLAGKKGNTAVPPSSLPAATAAPRGTVTLGPVRVIKRAPAAAAPKPAASEALQAAQLAEKQTGAPRASTTVDVHKSVAQTVTGPKLPPGYDRVAANMKAQPLADELRTKKGKYSHATLQSFQTSAGLKADGLYGPQSVSALRYFGAKNVPAALYKGTASSYAPPKGG